MNEQNQTRDKPSTRRRVLRILWSITQLTILLIFMGVFFAGGAAAGYIASLVKEDPVRSYEDVSEQVFSNHLTGFAYFNDKALIGQLRAEEDRRLVKKEEVSPHLINAIIATEDRHFYEHRGVDLKAIVRASLQDILGSPVQTGGSTLTQQLIKQTILTPEVSHERKAREIFLALRIERMFSKDQILEAYMNEMYFGYSANKSNIYGVQAAAKGIFGVEAKDLNIPQSAYIAGMLQAPSRYTPFEEYNAGGLEAGTKRQKLVLNHMLENGYITEQQHKEALAYDIKANLAQPRERAYRQYPFLMMEIEDRAAKVLVDQDLANDPTKNKDDLTRQEYRELLDRKRGEILRGGYHIYTTIDKNIFEMMDAIAKNPDNFGPNRTYKARFGSEYKEVKDALEEVGATLIDNKTGAVLGFAGGRNFEISQVNHTMRPRQPGSAMKPLAAYAPAFELGVLQPGSGIDDAPIALENGVGNPPHYPANWNHKFHGLISVREALRQSYNIPAIKAYLNVGIPESLSYVEKMGITTLVTPKDNPRVNDHQAKTGVIGGLTQGLTVEEITNAYSVFPNQGSFLDAYLIERIENSDGETIFEHSIKPQTVFSEQTAYLNTDIMRTVVKSGTGAALQKLVKGKRDFAGKTGTTNDDVDSWFVGYTPEVTLGVWIGYDIPYKLPKASPARSTVVWAKFMNGLFELYPDRYPTDSKFAQPQGIVSRAVCSVSGKLPTDLCHEAGTVVTEVFNQKFVPTETCDVHIRGRIIPYDDHLYLAKPETPDDMVENKVGIKPPEPVKLPDNPEKYKFSFNTLDWDKRLPDHEDPRVDDGQVPSIPQGASLQNGKLTWTANPEVDIVGYRVYRSILGSPFEKTGVVLQPAEKSYTLSQEGVYYVTAVDVAGKESGPSQAVAHGSLLPDSELAPEGDSPAPVPDSSTPLDDLLPLDPTLPPGIGSPANNGPKTNTPTKPKTDNGNTEIPLTPPIPDN
ncbi:transglycosylase domain-containing protein [Ammoniphilus sp. CFH 90114]|uniref:transglycosylase domain-containing protein n=1 Tax=Ammoniphilus sp. CFH 90114 TaxID=2493665 RepID=UPI00100EA7FE|nr:transglycosylase domain-containing protein [Ammoniphilus sp. CFH 90114]RXT13502.1 penicillin-binding protein [Ammoniphilus sp. CFH 90114]